MKAPAILGTLGVLTFILPMEPVAHPGGTGTSAVQAFGAVSAPRGGSEWEGDPVARLRDRIAAGEVTLAYDTLRGYLPALLEALEIPASSQALVFSRTSLQTDRIAPWTPRALYFNDEVYVGWVQDSPILEIASIHPREGAVFYTLDQTDPDAARFQHETTTCLMCHESRAVTGGVPGLIVRSVLSDRLGYPITSIHEGTTTDRTPLEERWGGWYVTGSTGGGAHAGNRHAPVLSHEVGDRRRYLAEMELEGDAEVTDLDGRFYVEPYLTPHSDLVAIMVLTHQAQVHNLITLVQEEVTKALRTEEMALRARGGEPPEGGHLPATLSHVEGPVERLVQALLFVKEAPLSGPMKGTSGFAEEFSARGPVDDLGRSLRDLDLERRLFRHPMSFLIYSDAFEALPDLAKRTVARRLGEVLRGKDASPAFQHLDADDRRAILEILEATKPGFLAGAEG